MLKLILDLEATSTLVWCGTQGVTHIFRTCWDEESWEELARFFVDRISSIVIPSIMSHDSSSTTVGSYLAVLDSGVVGKPGTGTASWRLDRVWGNRWHILLNRIDWVKLRKLGKIILYNLICISKSNDVQYLLFTKLFLQFRLNLLLIYSINVV